MLYDNFDTMTFDKARLMYIAGEIVSQFLDEGNFNKQ